jgi:hypothetical protein
MTKKHRTQHDFNLAVVEVVEAIFRAIGLETDDKATLLSELRETAHIPEPEPEPTGLHSPPGSAPQPSPNSNSPFPDENAATDPSRDPPAGPVPPATASTTRAAKPEGMELEEHPKDKKK